MKTSKEDTLTEPANKANIKQSILELIKGMALSSTGYLSFSLEFLNLATDNNADKLESVAKLFKLLESHKVKVCVNHAPGRYDIIGGGDLRTYVSDIDLIVRSISAYGFYMSKFNIIMLPVNVETYDMFIIDKVDFYGVDIITANENPAITMMSTYIHENIHALFNMASLNDNIAEGFKEVKSFKAELSKRANLNKLDYLKVIADSNYQEIICHLVTNQKFAKFVIDNSYQYQIGKMLAKLMPEPTYRAILIDAINQWSKYLFGIEADLIFDVMQEIPMDQFLGRSFYQVNTRNILGVEYESTNRFGKAVWKTKRFENQHSLDEILSDVTSSLPILDFDNMDNLNNVDMYGDLDEVEEIKNQVIKEMENPGAEEISPDGIVSFSQSVKRYNLDNGFLTRTEIECYLFCNPEENRSIWFSDGIAFKKEDLFASKSDIILNEGYENESKINISTIIFDGENHHYFAIWLHGDIYNKTKEIEGNKDSISQTMGDEYYEQLMVSLKSIQAIELNFSDPDYGKRPFISPTSDLSQNFFIDTYDYDDRVQKTSISLTIGFDYVLSTSWYKASRYSGVKYTDIKRVLRGQRLIEKPFSGKELSPIEKQKNEEADMNNSVEFDNIWTNACNAFSDFIAECIDDLSRQKLIEQVVGFHNKFCFTQLSKIPVGFTHNQMFKTIKNFKLSDVQRNAVAYLNVSRSGILGYDIGVGKTLSALASISNRMDTNNANKALVCIPKPVYQKWINDAKSHTVKQIDPKTGVEKEIFMHGALNHLNIVGLGNLNIDIIASLKEYTKEETKKIESAKSGYSKFYDKYKNVFENVEEEEADSDDMDVTISESNEFAGEEVKKKTIPQFSPNAKQEEALELVDELIAMCPIDVLAPFGITDEENKNAKGIATAIMFAFENNTLSSQITGIYTKLGIKWGSVKRIADIPNITHLSAIANLVNKAYSQLQQYYYITLGKLKDFPDKTIFFCTYSGLSMLGYKRETIDLMAGQLTEILSGSDMDDKAQAEYMKKIDTILERSILTAKLYYEDLGLNYICIDEAHNFKNLITSITKDSNAPSTEFAGNSSMAGTVKGGKVSSRALLGFMATMYVQNKKNGGNTCLLTATPFSNSPLEIYSMLTLSSYNYLRSLGYENVKKFVDDFINLKAELQISVDGSVNIKIEPVGFNNLNLLRRIIYKQIDFKTGEESKVERPCKITLPLNETFVSCKSKQSLSFTTVKPISTILLPTRNQQLIIDALAHYLGTQVSKPTVDDKFKRWLSFAPESIKEKAYSAGLGNIAEYESEVSQLATYIHSFFNTVNTKEGFKTVDKLFPAVAILKVLMAMRNVAISPLMFNPFVEYSALNPADIDSKMLVESSNKLLYLCGCIKKINQYTDAEKAQRKSFVVYSNLGTKPGKNSPISMITLLKDYLLDESNGFGYSVRNISDPDNPKAKYSEVELLTGETTDKRRKAIMKLFNDGLIKILITTVKEGVDLQGNTIALFNLSVDWNPTDAKQIEGRAWRQGNRNAYIIINYPLCANSSDMAIYQKLQDKTMRLKAIWDKSNVASQFDLGEWNPEQMKMEMISSVDKLAPFMYVDDMAEKKLQLRLLTSRYEEDNEIISKYQEFNANIDDLRYALYYYTRLPQMMRIKIDLKELEKEIESINWENENNEDELKNIRKSAISFEKLEPLTDRLLELDGIIKQKGAEIGVITISDDEDAPEKAKEVKKQADVLKKEKDVIQKQLLEIEKEIEKETETLKKDIDKKIKELKKQKTKLDEKFDAKKKEGAVSGLDPDFKAEHPLNDIDNGNYFIKSDSGGIIYKDKSKDLYSADWINKATWFDLLEAVTRVCNTYNYGATNSKIFSEYENAFSSKIRLEDFIKDFPDVFPKEIYDRIYSDFLSNWSEYTSQIMSFAQQMNSTASYGFYRLKNVELQTRIFTRAIKNYKSVIQEQDPDKYLADMQDKISLMKKEIGGGEGMSDIPDSMIEQYILKAINVVTERKRVSSDFIGLIDDFSTLKQITNIQSPYIKASIEDEVIDQVDEAKSARIKEEETKEPKITIESIESVPLVEKPESQEEKPVVEETKEPELTRLEKVNMKLASFEILAKVLKKKADLQVVNQKIAAFKILKKMAEQSEKKTPKM
jgi:hypothetical protein